MQQSWLRYSYQPVTTKKGRIFNQKVAKIACKICDIFEAMKKVTVGKLASKRKRDVPSQIGTIGKYAKGSSGKYFFMRLLIRSRAIPALIVTSVRARTQNKPHGGRRATKFLCRPVRQRQSVKDVSEEVTHTGRSPGRTKGCGRRHYAASGWRLLAGVLCPVTARALPQMFAFSGGPVSTQTVPISASGLRGSKPLVNRLM